MAHFLTLQLCIIFAYHIGLLMAQYISVPDAVVYIYGVRVLVYEPSRNSTTMAPVPATIYIHGGAWVGGTADISKKDPIFDAALQESKLFSIDYSTGVGFPYIFQENFNVIKFLLQHGSRFGIDSNKVVLMGGSAGGNLAAGVSYQLNRVGLQPKLRAQVLLSPALQATDFNTSSYLNVENDICTRQGMIASWAHYWKPSAEPKELLPIHENKHTTQHTLTKFRELGGVPAVSTAHLNAVDSADEDVRWNNWNRMKDVFENPQFAPLMAPSVEGLPPTVIYAGQQEIMRDDSVYYTHRLKQAGVEVNFTLDPQGHHNSAKTRSRESGLLDDVITLYQYL